MPPMPHVDEAMNTTESEYKSIRRPTLHHHCSSRPDYDHSPPRAPVYEYPPPHYPSYSQPPLPAWDWPSHQPAPVYSHCHHLPPPPLPPPATRHHQYATEPTFAATSYHPSSVYPTPCPATDLIYEVNDTDVLCGRGAPTNFHTGNQYFRGIVSQYQPMYLGAKRADKPEIACRVVERIQEHGGRFLKRTKRPGVGVSGHFCWVKIGEQRAYEKACQALREGAPEIRRRLAINELEHASVSTDSREGDDSPRSHEECERDCA